MPRVSRAVTAQHRAAIEAAAARMFRARGLHHVSVAEVMAAAGLTHGGFYGHFASKDALAAAACAHGFGEGAAHWAARVADNPDDPRRALVRGYLARRHRDDPAEGCPLTALAADVARETADTPVKTAYLNGLKALIAILEAAEPGEDARQGALADLATMVGALTLARAAAGDPLSDEILEAARAALLSARSPCGSRDRE